jgi:hypothetical protein
MSVLRELSMLVASPPKRAAPPGGPPPPEAIWVGRSPMDLNRDPLWDSTESYVMPDEAGVTPFNACMHMPQCANAGSRSASIRSGFEGSAI